MLQPLQLSNPYLPSTPLSWLGHPSHYIFGNEGDFESKLRSLISTVSERVGLPLAERSTVKFLMDDDKDWGKVCKENGVEYQRFMIEKVYLWEGENGGKSSGRVSPLTPSGSPSSGNGIPKPPPLEGGLSPINTPVKGSRMKSGIVSEYR